MFEMDLRREKVFFHEVQKFTQIWLWLIILFITGLAWFGFIRQILIRIPFGQHPAPNIVMIITWVIAGVFLPAFIGSTKLVTEVRGNGLYIQYFPFHLSPRRIAFDKLQNYEVRVYRPLLEYGGWGIRYGTKGQAYNMAGNRGVQLVLIDGKRILIGSQKPEEMVKAIDTAIEERQ